MPVNGARQFGRSAYLNAGAGTTTLSWGPLRRFQGINPTVALADVRLPSANGPEFPPDVGLVAFVVINANIAANQVRLRDQEGDIDITLAPGEAALVSRVYT